MTTSANHSRSTSTRTRALAAGAAVLSLAALPASASAAFRAGDVGFSIPTQSGSTWVYGDSWNAGIFLRNAMTLNGVYKGTVRNPARSTWFWPGAPFKVAGGRIAMYGAEVTQVKPGMWGMDVLGGIRAEFDPARPAAAKLKRMAPGIIWAAASGEDAEGPIVYGVDSNHHARAGRPQPDGTVKPISTMGGTISGQFSVVQEVNGKWWLVGQLPFLSRRVVAYPLSGQTGRVTGPAIKLITLPEPGPNRFTYAATIHPEYSGLMTYAVNGNGPGTPYGLQKVKGFWPFALYWARAAAQQAAAAKARTARRAVVARRAVAADSNEDRGNGKAKGNSKGRKSAASPINDDRVILWATEKQRELEQELARRQQLSTGQDWLGPIPDQLGPNMTPTVSAPATWDQLGADPELPVGEDSDAQQQDFLVPATPAGYRRQQAEAKAAIEAAKAALEDLARQLKAAEDRQKAEEKAAREAEKAAEAAAKLAEAQREAEDARGTDREAAAEAAKQQAEQAKQQAEAAKEAAKQAKEAARQAAEQARQQAEQAKAAAKAKEKAANGQGRRSWD